MGLFKSQEEKEDARRQKIEKALRKYGMETLTDEQDIQSVQKIVAELTGTGLMEAGATLGGGSEKDIAKVQMYYLRAILEQNFIMIRQLDRICSAFYER